MKDMDKEVRTGLLKEILGVAKDMSKKRRKRAMGEEEAEPAEMMEEPIVAVEVEEEDPIESLLRKILKAKRCEEE